ncbi:MAG: hypothetical protein LBT05_00020 [Planctomycetaceae bacterium]|jgi:hypothetical protein|nr:hypothetical protein [Planctomycetaceae bacterium]
MQKTTLLSMFISAFLFLAGCGGNHLSTEYVEGVVTLDGHVLADATISFSPVVEGQGISAVGKTDATGKYVLTAIQGGKDGAGTTVGKYNISVFKEEATKHYTDEQLKEEVAKRGFVDWGYKVVVPARYTNPASSGLTADVVKGKNSVNLDLKSK